MKGLIASTVENYFIKVEVYDSNLIEPAISTYFITFVIPQLKGREENS
jgi:hypothetical protein